MSIEAMLMAAGSKFKLPEKGEPFEGGYFVRAMLDEVGDEYALVISPQAEGTNNGRRLNWNQAMDYAQNLTINGFSDWALPDRDEAIILYRELKPNTQANVGGTGATDRVEPPLGNYTADNPAVTSTPNFLQNESESLLFNNFPVIWTSTSSPFNATILDVRSGGINSSDKSFQDAVRAVRRAYL